MKSYPLGGSPPDTPGLYAIKNRVTNQIYIGKATSLRRRYQEWRGVFTSGLGHKNPLLRNAATQPDDWDFQVMVELPPAAIVQIDDLERRAIRQAYARNPGLVLNVMVPQGRVGERRAKSLVLDEDGKHISTSEVARRLGTSSKQVQKRLAKRRARGEFETSLVELRCGTDAYRAKINPPGEARYH